MDPQLSSLITITTIVGTVLSLVGCLFTIITFLKIRELRHSPAFWLIVQLSIADLYKTIVYQVLTEIEIIKPDLCHWLGFFAEQSDVTCNLWPLMFAFTMFLFYRKKMSNAQEVRRYLSAYFVICWGAGIILAIIPLFFNAYGSGTISCYFYQNSGREIVYFLMIACDYAVTVFVLISMIFLYSYVIYKMKKVKDRQGMSHINELFFYPLVISCYLIFGIYNRFFNIGKGINNPWVMCGQILLRQGQGFINAIIYCSSGKVRSYIKAHITGDANDKFRNESILGTSLSSSVLSISHTKSISLQYL